MEQLIPPDMSLLFKRSFQFGLANFRRPAALSLAILGAAVLPSLSPAASLCVYLSPPGQQETFVTNATTETFNSLPVGNQSAPFVSPIGTYQFTPSSQFVVNNADQFGGAFNTRYVVLGDLANPTAPVTLNLNGNAQYFGFWWSAGDVNNGLTFYENNTLLARVSTADVVSLLGGTSLTAIDGSTYNTASYYGNPNDDPRGPRDSGQPFAYVNILARGTVFNKIVFDNSDSNETGFETDNHSIFAGSVTVPGGSVRVEKVPSPALAASPEPASLTLGALSMAALALLLRRQKRSV